MAERFAELKRLTVALALVLPLVLPGCVPPDMGTPEPSPRSRVPAPAPAPAPAPQPVPVPEPSVPGTVEPMPPPPPVRTAPAVSPASQALIAQSRSHAAEGRYEQAAASIERALRIDPRQPLLWLELGDIRLLEGDQVQAESLGRKALSLSSGIPALEARARQLISRARQR